MKKGFSLVELLVVMAIMGVLAVIGINSYVVANQKARNSRRAADISQIRSALEMYRTDNGIYPATNSWETDLRPYMSGREVKDPKNIAGSYVYNYERIGTTNYELSYLEEPDGTEQMFTNP